MHGARAKMAPGGGGNIKVVVRVRPFNRRGQSSHNPWILHALHCAPQEDTVIITSYTILSERECVCFGEKRHANSKPLQNIYFLQNSTGTQNVSFK